MEVTPHRALLLVDFVGSRHRAVLVLLVLCYVGIGSWLMYGAAYVDMSDGAKPPLYKRLLGLVIGTLMLPAAGAIVAVRLFVSGLRRRVTRSTRPDSIERAITEMRASLDAIAEHRQQIDEAAQSPDNDKIPDHLDELAAEWQTVADHAEQLMGLTLGYEVDLSGSLDDEWIAVRARWRDVRVSERVAPLPDATYDLTETAEVISHRAELAAGSVRETRQLMETNPDAVIETIRGDRDPKNQLSEPIEIGTEGTSFEEDSGET